MNSRNPHSPVRKIIMTWVERMSSKCESCSIQGTPLSPAAVAANLLRNKNLSVTSRPQQAATSPQKQNGAQQRPSPQVLMIRFEHRIGKSIYPCCICQQQFGNWKASIHVVFAFVFVNNNIKKCICSGRAEAVSAPQAVHYMEIQAASWKPIHCWH